MSCRGAVGQQFFGEKLAGKRCGTPRERLRRGSALTGHGARRIFADFHREEQPSVGTVEQVDEALF